MRRLLFFFFELVRNVGRPRYLVVALFQKINPEQGVFILCEHANIVALNMVIVNRTTIEINVMKHK